VYGQLVQIKDVDDIQFTDIEATVKQFLADKNIFDKYEAWTEQVLEIRSLVDETIGVIAQAGAHEAFPQLRAKMSSDEFSAFVYTNAAHAVLFRIYPGSTLSYAPLALSTMKLESKNNIRWGCSVRPRKRSPRRA
jgi:hypothetical protein